MPRGVNITAQRAREFGIQGQQSVESDESFRNRVSAKLRAMGQFIEAHEAYNNSLYDDPNSMAAVGIVGVVAQAVQGQGTGARTWSQQVGDDIAMGILALDPKEEMSPEMAMLMIDLFGRQ